MQVKSWSEPLTKQERDDLKAEDGARRAAKQAVEFLSAMADTLDKWAEESRSGGWSTHQVSANIAAANDCRRQAAALRTALTQ